MLHLDNPLSAPTLCLTPFQRGDNYPDTGGLCEMPAPTAEMTMEMWSFPMDRETGMNTYGAGGMLVKMEGKSSGVGGTMVYFGCEDCAVEAARAVSQGGILIKEKTSIGEHGFIALVQDTEGNMIGFHSMVCKPSE